MKSLIDSYKKTNNLHHAYILEGHHDTMYPHVCEFCEKELKFKTKANPDFYYEVFERFSIADARRLHDMQMRKTTDRGRKIFIVSFTFITKEAQNALLKVLEEPTAGTHFFFITKNSKILLDTVLSRVVVIGKAVEEEQTSYTDDAKKFLKSSYKDRASFVSKLVLDIKNEKKAKSDVLFFLQSLEEELHKDFLKKPTKESAVALSEISKAEQYAKDQGASVKQLLENISLVV